MNKKYVKYTSNSEQAKKYVFDVVSKEIGKYFFKCFVIAMAVVSIIIVGLMVL